MRLISRTYYVHLYIQPDFYNMAAYLFGFPQNLFFTFSVYFWNLPICFKYIFYYYYYYCYCLKLSFSVYITKTIWRCLSSPNSISAFVTKEGRYLNLRIGLKYSYIISISFSSISGVHLQRIIIYLHFNVK